MNLRFLKNIFLVQIFFPIFKNKISWKIRILGQSDAMKKMVALTYWLERKTEKKKKKQYTTEGQYDYHTCKVLHSQRLRQ